MKKKYKLGLIVVLVFLVIALVAVVLIKKNQAKSTIAPEACDSAGATTCKVDLKDASTPQTTKTTVGSFSEKQKITSNLYKNDKYKFEITFNDTWQNAQIKENPAAGSSLASYEFQLPTNDKNFADGYASALVIAIYPKDSYTPTSSLEMKLAENTQYIVSYRAWQQAPIDARVSEKEVANTAATFKFTN